MSTWKFNNEAEAQLKKMLSIVSPFSCEIPTGNYLREAWSELNCNIATDVMGNVYASVEGEKPIHIALVAHIDTVGIQITKITSCGMLLFRSIGMNPHALLAQSVEILTSKGIITGVIGFDPTSQYGAPKSLMEEDLWIDIGTSSKEESSLTVEVGDCAVLRGEYARIGESNIKSSAIDNRIGLFIINECLRWFTANGSPLHLHVIGSVQEELGLRGASVIANHKQLNACFIIDVDYATDTLTPHENQSGRLILGKGVGFHKKADNNIVLQRIAKDVANKKSLPYQISLGRRIYGGTDASAIQLQMGGVATVNINVPCRYMHSASEMCNIQDVETAVNLIIETIHQIAELNKNSFIPGID
jgi:endoglucanase